jgi:hypothetical protein
MLTSYNFDIVHLESTDVCQAACPQCGREVEHDFDKTAHNHLSVDQIKNILDIDTIKNLKKMFMCGNYGDPAAGKHTLDIYQYFREINPGITLGMNTNGGIGTTNWWSNLGTMLNRPEDYVIFSIDGLQDTNHLYRRNVIWDKVIENARAFISAGGQAHWEMLLFDYNEHQLADVKSLAQSMGFKFFNTKVSRRFKYYPVVGINPPTGYVNEEIGKKIQCHAIKENSVYISARGILHPCCWLGYKNGKELAEFDNIKQSWSTDTPYLTCLQSCSIIDDTSNFTKQWRNRIKIF